MSEIKPVDFNNLKTQAESLRGWFNTTDAWLDTSKDSACAVVGHISDEGALYPVAVVDCDQYDAPSDSMKLAKFYASANPKAILKLITAYEALQKENAGQKKCVEDLVKAYAREIDDCLTALEERDYWYDKADSLADKIGEVFDVPVGEHSNVNCPFDEANKILDGEYVTKFDKQIEALKSENEALRKQVEEHKEWHMMRDEMRKALEAQMGISNKWQS